MIYRIFLILLFLGTLNSCTPSDLHLINRNIQSVDIGENNTLITLSETNTEVDNIASEVSMILSKNKFILLNKSNSFGLLPATGHTVYFYYKYINNDLIRCVFTISKHQFIISFIEIETKPKSNLFNTSDSDIIAIKQAVSAIKNYASKKYFNHEIRISNYIH